MRPSTIHQRYSLHNSNCTNNLDRWRSDFVPLEVPILIPGTCMDANVMTSAQSYQMGMKDTYGSHSKPLG